LAHGAAGGDGGGRTQLLPTVKVSAMTVRTVSSPVFSSLHLFFSFFISPFSPLYPYSTPLFFLSIPLFLSCSPFTCFYRQKTGERKNGAAIVLPPLQHEESFGLCRRLFEREDGGDRGGKNLLLPLFRASRGRRRPTVPFKTTLFGSFFLMNSV